MDNTGDKQEVRRVIKRYSNRKLYDTRDSRYVTLLQIAEMVRRGEDVQIIDNTTKEDKTEVTLALAISEELKAKPRSVPLGTLRNLIQERGEKILTSLRDGPIGRLIPEGENEGVEEGGAQAQAVEAPATPAAQEEKERDRERDREREKVKSERKPLAELVASSRHTLDQWQHAIDDRIRAVLPNFSLFLDFQTELRRLKHRVEALEKRVGNEPGVDEEPAATQPEDNSEPKASEETSAPEEPAAHTAHTPAAQAPTPAGQVPVGEAAPEPSTPPETPPPEQDPGPRE